MLLTGWEWDHSLATGIMGANSSFHQTVALRLRFCMCRCGWWRWGIWREACLSELQLYLSWWTAPLLLRVGLQGLPLSFWADLHQKGAPGPVVDPHQHPVKNKNKKNTKHKFQTFEKCLIHTFTPSVLPMNHHDWNHNMLCYVFCWDQYHYTYILERLH